MKKSKGSQPRSGASWRDQLETPGQTRTMHSASLSKSESGFKIAGYIRLSPSDEVRDEGSLVNHPQRIEQFIAMKQIQNPGFGSIVEWYVDKEMSGKDMNRPAFRKMCVDIKSGKINAITCTELSRLSRSVKDFTQFWDFLKDHEVKLFSLKENFDTSTPMGELMLVQAISFSQFERLTIVGRIKDGARARAERGLSNGGPQPLGFDLDPHKRCHRVVNEDEAIIVRHIFDKFLELGTLAKLQAYLSTNGYRTKRYVTKEGREIGGIKLMMTTLHHLLTNLGYVGVREINKLNRSKDPSTVKAGDQYRIVKAHWDAIVPEETFNRVQELLENNKKKTRPYIHQYRLTGLLTCGLCGAALTGKSGTGRNGKYFYYGHMRKELSSGERHRERCALETISAPKLEEMVISRVMEIAKRPAIIEALIELSSKSTGSTSEKLDQLLGAREQDRRSSEGKIRALTAALSQAPGAASSSILLTEIESEAVRLKAIEGELSAVRAQRDFERSNVLDTASLFKKINEMNKNFRNLAPHEQSQFLRDFIVRIVIGKEETRLDYNLGTSKDSQHIDSESFFNGLAAENDKGRAVVEQHRPLVRSLYEMVETAGVEPASEKNPYLRLHA